MTTRRFVAISIALTALATSAEAAEPFAYVGTVPVLDFPVGVRNVGMGSTGVADMSELANGYFNPASLAWASATWLSYNHEDLLLDLEMNDGRLVSGHRWGDESSKNAWRLGGAIGYTAMDYEPVIIRTIYLPGGTGTTFEPDDYYLTAALAGAWERGGASIAVGMATKYVRLEYAAGDENAWAFDYGLVTAKSFVVSGSMLRPRAGFSWTNRDTGIEYDDHHMDIAGASRIGFGFDFASPSTRTWGRDVAAVAASFDADYVDRGFGDSYWAFGWEMNALQFVQVRAGYQWLNDANYGIESLGAGVGWEFGSWIIHADYAHVFEPSSFGVDRDRDLFGATTGIRF